MKNKTCGECKCYDMHGGCNKVKNTLWIHSTNIACIKFEAKNPTNGDRIRQKSNEEFARDYVHYHSKFKVYVARLCPMNKQLWTTREEAVKANLDWLNAPADAPDTNVGTKESEGKDE